MTKERERPQWVRTAGLVSASFPRTPLLQKYLGGQSVDCDEEYAAWFSGEKLDRFASSSVNLLWFRFYNGFGFEFEKQDRQRITEFFSEVHSRGMKAAASIAFGMIIAETMLLEEPESGNWLQVNSDGRAISASGAAARFAFRPCYNSEAYLRLMERICVTAAEAGADIVHLRELAFGSEPETCRCPVCVAAFREFVRKKYSKDGGAERFGHSQFTHLRPPPFGAGEMIQSPHQQEWLAFKVQTITNVAARMAEGVRKRAPQCAVSADGFESFDSRHDAQRGLSEERLLPVLDFVRPAPPTYVVFKHSDVSTGLAATGSPWGELSDLEDSYHRIRAAKIARAAGSTLFAPLVVSDCERALAENLAFSPAGFVHFRNGHTNLLSSESHLPVSESVQAFLQYYSRNKSRLLENSVLANVAVLRDFPSHAYTHGNVDAKLEFALMRRNIGWEYLFGSQLNKLSQFRTVILPDCQCLSTEAAQALEQFVTGGGSVLATDETGQFDECRRTRTRNPFADWLANGSNVQRDAGLGRFAFIRQFKDDAVFAEALSFVLRDEHPWTIETVSGRVLLEVQRTRSGATIVHAINLGDEPARGMQITVRCENAPGRIMPWSPFYQHDTLTFNFDNGRVHFSFDELKRYVLFEIH